MVGETTTRAALDRCATTPSSAKVRDTGPTENYGRQGCSPAEAMDDLLTILIAPASVQDRDTARHLLW